MRPLGIGLEAAEFHRPVRIVAAVFETLAAETIHRNESVERPLGNRGGEAQETGEGAPELHKQD
jgi:hypothetical protein